MDYFSQSTKVTIIKAALLFALAMAAPPLPPTYDAFMQYLRIASESKGLRDTYWMLPINLKELTSGEYAAFCQSFVDKPADVKSRVVYYWKVPP